MTNQGAAEQQAGDESGPRIPVALAVRDLRFAYSARAGELFDGFTHQFRPAALTAVTGPSGRGKSTLLHILGLLRAPTSGGVLVDGQPVSRARDDARSKMRATRFGFVFQDAELDSRRTVLSSVLEPARYAGMAHRTARDRAMELLTTFGLDDGASRRPGQISGGQAQRVALCRALLNQPGIVLADEPTGNLDHENADRVLEALAAFARRSNATVVIATHDDAVIGAADEVVAL